MHSFAFGNGLKAVIITETLFGVNRGFGLDRQEQVCYCAWAVIAMSGSFLHWAKKQLVEIGENA